MTNSEQGLDDRTTTVLQGLGVRPESINRDGDVISGTDKWDDDWTVFLAADIENLDTAAMIEHKETAGFLVLVSRLEEEEEARSKFEGAGLNNKGGPRRLVWSF